MLPVLDRRGVRHLAAQLFAEVLGAIGVDLRIVAGAPDGNISQAVVFARHKARIT